MSDPHDREPIDQATIDCWRANYGLDKRTPAQAARYWSEACAGMAPAGAVAALGVALDELAADRKDAERYRWLRDRAVREAGPVPYCVIGTCPSDAVPEEGAALDAAIDAAMAVGAA